MRTSLPVKIAVLTVFVGLIGTFVTFRSGFFNEGSDNTSDSAATSDTDTIVKNDTVVPQKEMMSGSKDMILIDQTPDKKVQPPKAEEKEKIMMHGSKSGKVITPEPSNANNAAQSNTSFNLNESMMGSSKSGIIFKPEKDSTKKDH